MALKQTLQEYVDYFMSNDDKDGLVQELTNHLEFILHGTTVDELEDVLSNDLIENRSMDR